MNFINKLTKKDNQETSVFTNIEITEYIDLYNIEHLKAYAVLNKTGIWPENFIPENVVFGNNWQTVIAYRMAKIWIEQALAGNIIGMPTSTP